METLQIILTSSLIVLCLMFIGTLIYLVVILKDLKESIDEAKGILKTVRKVSSSVVFPLTSVMGVIGGISKGLKTVKSITNIFESEEDEEDEED